MWNKKLQVASITAMALSLAACGTTGTGSMGSSSTSSIPVTSTTTSTSSASGYGVIQSINLVATQQQGSNGVGLGAVAGAVVGGVLGNQVGSGNGRTAATVAGAAGGALAGNQMQKNSRAAGAAGQAYQVAVRMDNGAMQTLMMDNNSSSLQVGERVRVDNGVIVERLR